MSCHLAEVYRDAAVRMGSFIHKSPSPFHVAANVSKMLTENNFKKVELSQSDWGKLSPGGYFLTKNDSAVIAFTIPENLNIKESYFKIVGTHTDSPCLKLKPNALFCAESCSQVSVECYGGGLWDTWFDRPLKMAGRIVYQSRSQNKIQSMLVNIDEPLLCIPHLAIHLDRTQREAFKYNAQTNLNPILSAVKEANILDCISKNVDLNDAENVLDAEFYLAEYCEPLLTGANKEFLSCPRLDNLFNTYTAFQGLLKSHNTKSDKVKQNYINVVAAFDNEEVGSCSAQGADSVLLSQVLQRIVYSFAGENEVGTFHSAVSRSLLISADQAHATHPNYADKHDPNHKVSLTEGCVLKYNANQRYTTQAVTASIIKKLAAECEVPVQTFVSKNDVACGSTIGPMLSSSLCIDTVDIGFPMLAMHSIREFCAAVSVAQAETLYAHIFSSETN